MGKKAKAEMTSVTSCWIVLFHVIRNLIFNQKSLISLFKSVSRLIYRKSPITKVKTLKTPRQAKMTLNKGSRSFPNYKKKISLEFRVWSTLEVATPKDNVLNRVKVLPRKVPARVSQPLAILNHQKAHMYGSNRRNQ